MTIFHETLALAGLSFIPEEIEASHIGCVKGAIKAIGEELFPDDKEDTDLNECSYWEAKIIMRAHKMGIVLPDEFERVEELTGDGLEIIAGHLQTAVDYITMAKLRGHGEKVILNGLRSMDIDPLKRLSGHFLSPAVDSLIADALK